MEENISKTRKKRIGRRTISGSLNRTFLNQFRTFKAFKNGSVLAVFYAAVAAAIIFWCGIRAKTCSGPYCVGGDFPAGAALVMIMVAFGSSWAVLKLTEPHVLKRNSRISMLLCIVVVSVVLRWIVLSAAGKYFFHRIPEGFGIFPGYAFSMLIPYFTAPALAALTAGSGAGVAVGIGFTALNFLSVGGEAAAQTLISGLIAGTAIPLMTPRVYKRANLLRIFASACLLQLFCLSVFHLLSFEPGMRGNTPDLGKFMVTISGLCVLSGILSYIFTVFLLPPFEHIFAATSNIRLNEFTDLGHKLLCELSLKAPGTYHHSIVVATLASAAAERIGANALLARAGAYFHDIGKLENTRFFVENAGGENAHDALSPNMSALIIMSHVKNGESYACNYNLPPEIKDIMRQHHGNALVRSFYKKALENAEADRNKGLTPIPVNESQFRYPGPLPTSKEAAIVMIADSVEAASRNLARPTTQAIERLVNQIADDKARDGQFDLCPISTSELAVVKRVFVSTLQSQLHKRVAYPTPESIKPAR